jgi:hypothetical protein
MRRLCVILLTLTAIARGVRAAETPRAVETSMRAAIARLAPLEKAFLTGAPYAGHYSLDDLVTFSTRQDRLVATFHLPPALERQFRDPAPLLISLEGSHHIWSLHRRKAGTLDPAFSLVTLTCYAPDDKGPFNRYTLGSDGDSVMVSAGQMFGPPATQQSIALSQGEKSLHLLWRLQLDKWSVRSIDLASLSQVPVAAPGLLESYLLPVLRRLGPALPASDVYRVFDQLPADPKVTRQVWPLLTRLDSGDPRDRDAALADLQNVGRRAIHACLHIDPATLSPEQQTRLASLYASEGWMHVADPDTARRDPAYLTSCLEDPDPAVRLAATNLLAALRAVPDPR